MRIVTIPPKTRANGHLHQEHETAIDMLSGTAEMRYGDQLDEYLIGEAGDYLFIPAGIPYLPANPSQTETALAVLARTDPKEQERVVLLPELNASGLTAD